MRRGRAAGSGPAAELRYPAGLGEGQFPCPPSPGRGAQRCRSARRRKGGIGGAAPEGERSPGGNRAGPPALAARVCAGQGNGALSLQPFFFFLNLVFWLFFLLTDWKNIAELSAHLPRWKPCLVLNLSGAYVLLAPVGPMGTWGGGGGNPWKRLGGVSGRWGALLELGFHFRKESGVTAIPGQQIVAHQKVWSHSNL